MENNNEFVSLGLIENSFDFIEKGLEAIISENEKEYKYAVLHLFSGVLLFLKDLLYKEHWRLIFQDIDSADRDKLNNGDIKSVNFDTLISRLKQSNDLSLSDNLIKELRWMQKERNKIEHFYNQMNPNEVKSRIAMLLNNLIIFIREHKESDENYSIEYFHDHDYEYQALFEMIQDYSFKFESFVDKRNSIIKKELSNSYLIIQCPVCGQKAVELKPDLKLTKCHFCLEEHTFEWFFNIYSPISFDQDKADIKATPSCPECDEHMLYDDNNTTICFNCTSYFTTSKLSSCLRCDNTVVLVVEDEDTLCDQCLEDIFSRY